MKLIALISSLSVNWPLLCRRFDVHISAVNKTHHTVPAETSSTNVSLNEHSTSGKLMISQCAITTSASMDKVFLWFAWLAQFRFLLEEHVFMAMRTSKGFTSSSS